MHIRSQDAHKMSRAKASTAKLHAPKVTPGASSSKDDTLPKPSPLDDPPAASTSAQSTTTDPPPDTGTNLDHDDHDTTTNHSLRQEETQGYDRETQGYDEELQGQDACSDGFSDISDEEEMPAHEWDGNTYRDPFECDSDSDDEFFNITQQPRRDGEPSISTAPGNTFYPYQSQTMMVTDMLFNSPRMKFSRPQQKAVLSWAKQIGARDVPSHSQFLSMQQELLERVGDPSSRQRSSRGNIYYLNEIGNSIAKDIANPITRPDMVFYPEDGEGRMGEVWHGDKMLHDIPDSMLSPTYKHDGTIYWVDELVKRSEGLWFIPKRWITRNGLPFAVGHHVHSSELITPTADSAESAAFRDAMPHPLRATAKGRMVYSIPLIIFEDDVSGNRSKQWNKHYSCYMSNGALPRTKLDNEFHVRFVATSPHAAPLEIMQGVRSSIENAFKDPIEAWDCESGQEVLLRPYALFFPGDNPMQAEMASSSGLSSNHFCRTCKVGGTREFKQSNNGFETLFKAGEERDCKETAEKTVEQLMTALQPFVATTLTEAARKSGVKDSLAQPIIDHLVKLGQELRKASPEQAARSPDEIMTILADELAKAHQQGGVLNPLVNMDGVQIHKDTPTEILHTILLGVVKYFWGQTMWHLEKNKHLATFQVRLNSVAEEGLNIPPITADYMCQYRGGLIGKHFKTLSQIMAFTLYELVPREVLDAWLIIGRLTVLLWHTEIDDVPSYTTKLEECIKDFLNVTCQCSPSILISKPKFHFLLHLPFYIQRFGPALLFSTERFESYNAVFRGASIYSNHLAPSRDIAWTFARMDRVKHIMTGGWWKDTKSNSWVCASSRVMQHILDHRVHSALLGLSSTRERLPGTVSIPSTLRSATAIAKAAIEWQDTQTFRHALRQDDFPMDSSFVTATYLVTRTGDRVSAGSYVAVRAEATSLCAQICEIVQPIPRRRPDGVCALALVCVELFEFDATRHAMLDMPTVARSSRFAVLAPSDIICAVNLQHDCSRGQCAAAKTKDVYQEREKITQQKLQIAHSDTIHYILNTQSLHNYRALSELVPHHLQGHRYHVPDEAQLRRQAAEGIRKRQKNQVQAQEDLLISQISDRAEGGTEFAQGSGTDLLDSLQTDGDLVNVLQGILERGGIGRSDADSAMSEAALGNMETAAESGQERTDSQRLASQHENPPPAAQTMPVFVAGPKAKSKGKKKATTTAAPSNFKECTIPVLQQFCRQYHLKLSGNKDAIVQRLNQHYAESQISQPNAAAFATASAEAQLHKASQPAPTRKRKQADMVDGDAVANGSTAGPAKRRRGGQADISLQLTHESTLPLLPDHHPSLMNQSHADDLASDGPLEFGDDDFDSIATGGANSRAGSLTHSHSRQSSISRSAYTSSPSFGHSSSVLGRRGREGSTQPGSAREKVRIREFATDKCAEYELSAADAKDIVRDSQLTTHELLVIILCKVAHNTARNQEDGLVAYFKTNGFKDKVSTKLKTMLLDPGISSYKNGFLGRVMRHLRLNAGPVYGIPLEIRELVASSTFASMVSKVLTTFRSTVKTKLAHHWEARSDIYTLVRDLSPSASMEPSEELWCRWAWVHYMYADFIQVIKKPGAKYRDKDFWDWLDLQLEERRSKCSDVADDEERAAKFNGVFQRALAKHKKQFKPKAKPSAGRPLAWQKAVAAAVAEMHSYTQEELLENPGVDQEEHDSDLDEPEQEQELELEQEQEPTEPQQITAI
ncbi:hypothetical protein HWV62_42165 [Athelia sp. TMB]|nr:hypothetical protein HWV62_42165 [Athelia sp. TMB]